MMEEEGSENKIGSLIADIDRYSDSRSCSAANCDFHRGCLKRD